MIIPIQKSFLGHCPDFAVILVHHHRQILVNICGTRCIPTPHMSNVFMNLMADTTEFLTGKAHRGMALGSNNIYERCKDAIIKGRYSITLAESYLISYIIQISALGFFA